VCELLAKNKNKNIIITGDFNIDTNKDNAKKSSFIDLLNSYALHLNVKDNTRVCSTSSSCIDNIITSIYNKVDVDVLDPHLSDHYAIFLDMQYIEKIKVGGGHGNPLVASIFRGKKSVSNKPLGESIFKFRIRKGETLTDRGCVTHENR
jgi:hypothetical protein